MSQGTIIADQYLDWYNTFKTHFKLISIEAWTTLLLQIFKIYAMNTVTLKQFKIKEGQNIKFTGREANSDFLSLPETILIKWCSHIASSVFYYLP